ncbi:UvrD-helicase domain-containing protein [Heyndrickxia sp. NPDC080065]|uniref:UvrD-helicase domain-containing protein n=1 Tax=Heyndrickxia sp. NPDC080065 TaxID=3390568 RepID=UPI003CFFBEF7
MSRAIVDQHHRDKIEQDLQQTFLVEAGAGSGKTTSLVNRMVSIVRTGTYKINEIAAITFTRKAAEELKMRFQLKLEREWRAESNESRKTNLNQALKNIDQCYLGTVHSFCARLLRERPIEAGLDLEFKEIEDDIDSKLAEASWDTYFEDLISNDPIKLQELTNLGVPLSDLRKSFLNMKTYPDVEWMYDLKSKPNLNPVFQTFLHLLREANHAIPVEPIEGKYDPLQDAILKALRKNKFENTLNDHIKIDIFELFNKKLSITQKLWVSKEDAKYHFEKISDFFVTSVKPLLLEWYEYVHGFTVPLMKEVMEYYEILKKEQSYVNFQDLLMKTAKLLRDNSEVRSYFQQKYCCLFIDEYQDTDPIQAEIMFFLTSEDSEEKDWTRCKPKPGSLFVVGDPKQAIYRFRRADIDIYNKVKELIVVHGGEVLELTMNFRTLDSVTSQLNRVFQQQLPKQETEYQAAFNPLHSFFEDDRSVFSGIHQLLVPKKYSNKEAVIQYDSEQIALTIKGMIQKGYNANQFMVLTRYNENLDVYYRALLKENIPASLSGDVVLSEIEEFQELCYLIEFIQDPLDQVQLLAVLRGSFFGISDQHLFEWKQDGGEFDIYFDSTVQTNNPIFKAFEKLRVYIQWKRDFSPAATIEKIIEDIGFYLLLMMNGYGIKEYQTLMQLFDSIRGEITFKEAAEKLKEYIFSSTSVINMDGDENSVRVMNVHKAKGLEAEIVFLANPCKKVNMRDRISYHIKRTNTGANGYFIFTKPNGYSTKTIAQPPSWESYQEEEYLYLMEEEARILYVAATRAEKALIISTCESNNKKNPWQELVDILKPEIVDVVVKDEKEPINKGSGLILENNYYEVIENEKWVFRHVNHSFNTFSPTDSNQNAYTLYIEREEGGGKAWGTMIHEVFEKLVKGIHVENHLDAILEKHRIPLERKYEVLQVISQFQQTTIWTQIIQAENVLTEAPFTMKIGPENLLYQKIRNNKDNNQSFLIKGVIDLAYQYDGKWYIIDYKTDRIKDKETLATLALHYEHQISFYKEVWEQITKVKIHEASLYFVTMDEIYRI